MTPEEKLIIVETLRAALAKRFIRVGLPTRAPDRTWMTTGCAVITFDDWQKFWEEWESP